MGTLRTTGRMIAATAALSCMASIAPLTARQDGRTTASYAIGAFNDCIQKRFEEINDRFGVARIVRIGETPHRFQPESATEMTSVQALEQARLEVVLYVAGTRVLRPTPTLPFVGDVHARAIIKGPVRVTSASGSNDRLPPPAPSELWDEGRRAMSVFHTRGSHEFTRPGWTFTARPVRATGAVCLECHQNRGADLSSGPSGSVKLGDALGVVIYGYRPMR